MKKIHAKHITPMNEPTQVVPVFSKMDKRFAGFPEFKFLVEFKHKNHNFILHRAERIKAFNNFRNWCVETWGPSIERDDYLYIMEHQRLRGSNDVELNPAWCYHAQEHQYKIYLCGQEEVVWTKLKWL